MTKTNTRSRIVSILLVLMMLLTMVPITGVTASAAEPEWTTVNSYEDLKTAVAAKNAYIKLGQNIDTTNLYYPGSGINAADWLTFRGQTCTLDLNGKTLTFLGKQKTLVTFMRVYEGSNLTIKDSQGGGKIIGSFKDFKDEFCLIHANKSSLTLEGGTFEVSSDPYKYSDVIRSTEGSVTVKTGVKLVAPEYSGESGYALSANTYTGESECGRINISGGEFDGYVSLSGSKSTTSNEPTVKISDGVFKKNVSLGYSTGTNFYTTYSPVVEVSGGEFYGNVEAGDWQAVSKKAGATAYDVQTQGYMPLRLIGGTFYNKLDLHKQEFVTQYYSDTVFYCVSAAVSTSIENSAIVIQGDAYTSADIYNYLKPTINKGKSYVTIPLVLQGTSSNPVKIIRNAWGMKSVTLDGNPIDYFKDWKGTVERMDNSTAHTLKFEWYPLAQELKDAGYTYRANFDCYTVGSNTPTTSVPISATATEYSHTIPAGEAPSVYPFDLQLNLDKNGSSVGIVVNQHIVKLVVSEAPVAPPSLTGQVYYTSGIVYGSPISIAASVTPAEATKSYQWQRSTDGGSTWTNIEGATSGRYTPVAADMGENVRIRVKVTAEGYLGEIVGAAVKVSKVANNNYPEVIKLEAVKNGAGNYTGFKITNFDSDYEYVYSTTDAPNWSANQISSATVTGLTSNTTYYVFARFKETATHTAGSIVSNNSIKLYDNVPLNRVLLEGYGSHGTIYIKKGESVTLKVSADPSNANYWSKITFKDEGATTSNIAISNGTINASTGTATPFPNGHTITITGVSTGSANLRASYPSATSSAYGTWYVVVYDDSTVANALRLESVYAYADITLSENDEAGLPTDLPKLLPANSGYHLEWRILKRGTYGATYVTENDNIKLEDGKIKPKAAHAASEKAQLELVAVKDGSTEYKTLPKKSLFYVTVTEAPVIELTGITVAPTKVNLELNATYQLSAVKEPVNAAGSLNWESSNTGVATVDSTGKVTAKAQGTAIITVSCGDKKATCTVTVDHQHDYSGQPYLYLDPGNHYQECKAGDGYNIQAHEFTPWTDNGNGTHSRHCTVCKMTDGSTYTETTEHTWVWVVDQEAALNQPGKQHEECTGCHAKRSENTEIPALRDYAVTVTGGTATVAAGTTITRAMEGVEVTVTAQAPGGKHFVKWVVKAGGITLANETSATTTFTMPANDVKIEAVFAENPVEAYTLTVIKGTASVAAGTPITDKIEQNTVVTVTADAPEAGKVFDKWVVLEGNVTLADAAKATTTFTMPANDVKLEATYKDAAPSHTHSYGKDWMYDDTNHWHECQCGDKADVAAHSASEWIVDTAATETADGAKHKECTVCKKVLETATVPATGSTHTHSYGTDWMYDGTNHWHECKCGDKADIAAHSASEWIVDKAATETAVGAKHKECTVCKKVLETATIPAAGSTHTHSYGTDWKYDDTNHWHECECGDEANTAAHSFQWVIDKAATKEATGIKHEECTVCGAKRSENTVIDKLPDGGNTGNTDSGDNNTDKPGKDDSTKSPQTGDSSNLIGWLAALFVSGGVLTVLGLNGKKRKESEAE